MFCDIESYLCTVNFEALALVLVLATVGILAALYGVLEHVIYWWNNRKQRGDKNGKA